MNRHTLLMVALLGGLSLAACSPTPNHHTDAASTTQATDTPAIPVAVYQAANDTVDVPVSAPAEPSTTAPVAKPAPQQRPRQATAKPASPSKDAPIRLEAVVPSVDPEPATAASKPNHSAWHTQLQRHVSNAGVVNYQNWKREMGNLDAYLADLAAHPPLADWSRAEQMAYWINAYNAFTVKLILDNYPLNSIRDLKGGNPWDHKWIKLGTDTYSLNEIENVILRPRYRDARIHFAVNCAAKSCPPLSNRAFTPENLNSQLERLTRAFVNDSRYNTLTAEQAQVSKIFDWYAADFGDLRNFLNQYATVQLNAGATVGYTDYDWALNGN